MGCAREAIVETDERLESALDRILLARSTLELNNILRAIR